MAFQQNFLGVSYWPTQNARCLVHGIAVGTAPVLALPAATRAAIFFHNPGLSIPLWVYPALNAQGASQALAAGAAGTFLLNPTIGLEINPCGSGAWYAIALNAGAVLTATEF